MKKSFSIYGITSFIFLLIGSIYIISGLLIKDVFISYQSFISFGPESIFIILGASFFIVGMILLIIELRRRCIYNMIINNGDYIRVRITKVKHVTNVKVNRRSPYVIYATHSDLPTNKKMKSFNLWEKPNFSEGDRIKVLAHSNYPCNFVIEEQ